MRTVGHGVPPCVFIDGILNLKNTNGIGNRWLEGTAVAYRRQRMADYSLHAFAVRDVFAKPNTLGCVNLV